MRDPHLPSADVMMQVAGDDDAARQWVMALATELGFDAVDLGPLLVFTRRTGE